MESTEGALAARATEPFLRDGLFEVPKTMSIGGDSEGAIYDLPGNKILKVKTQGITSAEEEANALVALGEKGIRVPRVFEIGKTTDGHDALIMQKVDADSYRDLILSGDRGRLTNALHDFTRQIGIMTKTGVAADDIQFGNILIGPKGEVSFIDPLRIVSTPHEFKVNRIIENMILNGARP
jgi:RIO-like serine/threonine protein kinase